MTIDRPLGTVIALVVTTSGCGRLVDRTPPVVSWTVWVGDKPFRDVSQVSMAEPGTIRVDVVAVDERDPSPMVVIERNGAPYTAGTDVVVTDGASFTISAGDDAGNDTGAIPVVVVVATPGVDGDATIVDVREDGGTSVVVVRVASADDLGALEPHAFRLWGVDERGVQIGGPGTLASYRYGESGPSWDRADAVWDADARAWTIRFRLEGDLPPACRVTRSAPTMQLTTPSVALDGDRPGR